MIPISSWGRLTSHEHKSVMLNDRNQVDKIIGQGKPGIAYGMGRSYGDVCLNPGGILWRTAGLDRLIAFDRKAGTLTCEAGVLLRDILRLVVPSGWILPVTPGTQIVTVGGAIANDVHGKNHHIDGSFGDHIEWLKLVRTDGSIIECCPNENREWFTATVGGLGLTGVITEARIKLKRVAGAWLDTETIPYTNIVDFFNLADISESSWEHTVSWIDCLSGKGRGIFMRGNPSQMQGENTTSRKLRVPITPPFSLVNKFTLRPFNYAYFSLKKMQSGKSLMHYEPFFYPLDNLSEWNRMYGPKGFYQYQSVVPRETGHDAVLELLKQITKSGEGSFLAVIKTFGNRTPMGMMSFPMPGVTLALDFPNRGKRTLQLMDRLDSVVKEAGGRLYLAKDARMPVGFLDTAYPKWKEFIAYRDPGISSALSRRLLGV